MAKLVALVARLREELALCQPGEGEHGQELSPGVRRAAMAAPWASARKVGAMAREIEPAPPGPRRAAWAPCGQRGSLHGHRQRAPSPREDDAL
jgi:hypothetical protein